jgi:hypothetical protein
VTVDSDMDKIFRPTIVTLRLQILLFHFFQGTSTPTSF